jgi:excisionase family DNA binding protein
MTSLTPSASDCEGARQLAHLLQTTDGFRMAIPETIKTAVLDLLQEISDGHSIAIVSADKQLTPQQAADYLNVSRTFFMRAIHNKSIASIRVGTHYRVKLSDVLSFKEQKEKQKRLIGELIAEAEELQLGY